MTEQLPSSSEMQRRRFGRLQRRIEEALPRWGLAIVIFVVLIGGLGSVVHVPYFSIGPGPTRNALELIGVEDAKIYPSAGKLLLTTASVSTRTLTVWEWVGVWIDPGYGTIARDVIIPPGVTNEQQDADNVAAIERSKIDAVRAVYAALDRGLDVLPGARILSVVEGAPADGVLRQRDLILSVDGKKIREASDVTKATARRHPGDTLRVTFRRGRKERTVKMRTEFGPRGNAVIGIFVYDNFRLPRIEIESERIVGPSAGLVFALTLSDLLTEEDLTKGHTIAVTGQIEVIQGRGIVMPIGAVGEKVRGAVRDGADYFVVPKAEVRAAQEAAPPSMQVIGVETLDEAIDALRELPPAV